MNFLASALYNAKGNNTHHKHEHSHKKSVIQPRFYATHKKRKFIQKVSQRKLIQKVRISKPSNEEPLLRQEVVHETETALCGICFKEEDKDCKTEIN